MTLASIGLTREEAIEYIQLMEELEYRHGSDIDYSSYADDAEGFIEQVLGETLTDDLREICRSVVKYRITFAQSGNGTGKSWISARIALWFFKCRFEPQVYCAAAPPETNLTNILWAEIETTCSNNESLVSDCESKRLKYTRKPKEFMTGVTVPSSGTDAQKQARFSGKHAPSLLFIFDEGDALPDPVYAGTETCMSGGFARMLVTFNPRERRGHVYREIKAGRGNVVKLSAFNHPSVIDGVDYYPGAVNRNETLRRIAQWTRPLKDWENRDKTCFKLPDYLVGCVPVDEKGNEYPALIEGWYKIVDHQFSHVVLGEYPAQAENQLISEEWIDAARERYDLYVEKHGITQSEHIACKAGFDVAEFGGDNSVLTERYGNFVHPQTFWQKMDLIELGNLAKDHFDTKGVKNIDVINCDGTGVGSGLAPYLAKTHHYPAVSVKVANSPTEKAPEDGEFGLLLDQLMWAVREWLRTELAMLPPDEELIEELLAFTYGKKNGKLKVSSTDDIKDLLKRSPDRARSLMMTFHKGGMFDSADLS